MADHVFGNYCYEFRFDRDPENGTPRLYLEPATCTGDGLGEGAARIYGTLDCCGEDYAIFSFGGEVLCPGTMPCPSTSPSKNVARYRVEWDLCAKWYCAFLLDLITACSAYSIPEIVTVSTSSTVPGETWNIWLFWDQDNYEWRGSSVGFPGNLICQDRYFFALRPVGSAEECHWELRCLTVEMPTGEDWPVGGTWSRISTLGEGIGGSKDLSVVSESPFILVGKFAASNTIPTCFTSGSTMDITVTGGAIGIGIDDLPDSVDGVCEPYFLTEDDVCTGSFLLCSGPYDTCEEAAEECSEAGGCGDDPEPPRPPEYILNCLDDYFLPDIVKVTITSDCPHFPGTVITYGEYQGRPGELWVINVSGEDWSINGSLLCSFFDCGGYCNGPVTFDGGVTCTPTATAFACCTYYNQTGSGELSPRVDCTVVLNASGYNFTLVIEDYGPGP